MNDMTTGNKQVIFLFLLVLLSTMLIAPSAAQTLPERVYVNESYTEETPDWGYLNFSRIQDAIDGVAPGGEVWVFDGTYYGSLIIDKNVHVTTVAHQAFPGLIQGIIDADGEENGIEIYASDVSFRGFDIRNASRAGIYVHNADSINIIDNIITLFTETDDETFGIIIEEGDEIRIVRNQINILGHSVQSGIVALGISDATLEENKIYVLSSGSEIVPVGVVRSVLSARLQDEEKACFTFVGAPHSLTRTDGISVIESSNVAVLNNWVTSLSSNIDEEEAIYRYAETWGIRSCTSERVQILNNTVSSFAESTDSTRSIGIYGSGNLALIEGNEVQVFTNGKYVQPVGVRLGYSEKGRVQKNIVNVKVDCTRTSGHMGVMRPAGIIAFDSYKAQIIENDIYYTLLSTGTPETSRVQVHGVFLDDCDEARVRENLAIVENIIVRDPDGIVSLLTGEMFFEDEEDPLCVCGIISGFEIARSDKPEILDNVIQILGTVVAYQNSSEDTSYTGVEEELTISGIHLHGGLSEIISSPLISGNSVIVAAKSIALAGQLPYEEEFFAEEIMKPEMQERYTALVNKKNAVLSDSMTDLTPYIHTDQKRSSLDNTRSLLEMSIEEISIIHVRVTTVGIILEDVLNPVICNNYVPVFQDIIIQANSGLNPPIERALNDTCPGVGLIDRLFRSDQMEKAFLQNLINENKDEWQNLPELDRSAIKDAVLSGDGHVLARYAEDQKLFLEDSKMSENILEYITILQNEEPFEFLNESYVSAAIPVSVSYGLLAYAEGDMEINGNEFTLMNDVASISLTDNEERMVNDTVAVSAGMISTFGIRVIADTITISDNNISIENNGQFLTASRGGESELSDAVAASGHLIISMGIIADAEDEYITNNEIRIEQSNVAMVTSLNRIKDRMALSAAGMAGLATGIVLDPDTILSGEHDYQLSIKDPEEIENLIRGNNITIYNTVLVASSSSEELTPPLDGSSTALSGAASAAASFGIVAPEAVILDNTIDVTAQQISLAQAIVEERYLDSIQSDRYTHPGAGAANIGVAISAGILTSQSNIANNDIFTNSGSISLTNAVTEELLENAGVMIAMITVDAGIVSLAPSYIDGNTVDGVIYAIMVANVHGDRVEIEDIGVILHLGILSIGGDATFNNIYNGYIGLPYYDEEGISQPFASHNWWGDESGPSGIGPGIGSAVMGTTFYEPWLTRSSDEVKETGKSYFGIEIGSPFIGGDDYRSGLNPGWNTLSFPLALEDNSWKSITESGDGLDYAIAYSWNPINQRWVQVTDTTQIYPLDAIYIRMNNYDRLPVQISPEITGPPVRNLNRGWNLIGPAYDLFELNEPIDDKYLWWGEPYSISVIKALASVEETADGKTGYNIVISPAINPDTWVFTRNEYEHIPGIDATRGYWIYMENQDLLAGFSTTPLPMPVWFWDLYIPNIFED